MLSTMDDKPMNSTASPLTLHVHQRSSAVLPEQNFLPEAYRLPDGSQRVNFLPPTDSEGQTQIVLDPIDLPKGTMVPYQVCVAGLTESATCLNESFLIWEEE